MTGPHDRDRVDVVAVVASAGGLDALSLLLGDLPVDLPAAVVLQQHLGPTSVLPQILERRTGRSVAWAVADTAVTRETVAVCPPGHRMEIRPDGTCSLSPVASSAEHPHDALLTSLARSYGARALAVVLTGGGTDGATGTAALRAAGGAVIAQDEATAEHSSTPRAAARAGADLVLPLPEIARIVTDLVRGRFAAVEPGQRT